MKVEKLSRNIMEKGKEKGEERKNRKCWGH